jgi:predicted phage tail protein
MSSELEEILEHPRPGLRVLTRVARKGGDKGDPSAYGLQPTQSPGDLRSISYATGLDAICEGQIAGPHTRATNFWASLYLDGTPFQNADGSYNFRAPVLYFVAGTPSQEVIPGVPSASNTIPVGTQMLYSEALIRRLNPGTTSVNIIVQVDALFFTTQQGNLNDTQVTYNIYYRIGSGGWNLGQAVSIMGQTTAPYQRGAYLWFGDTGGLSIDIQLFRTTPDNTDAKRQDALRWVSYTENVDTTLNYADTSCVGWQVDSHYWPSIPQRAYLLDGLIIQVPSNYDPIARTYSGDWDGTFQWAWTNNPAWVLYDLLVNERYGCGRDIDATLIDKWSFYEAAQYNDGVVPDGEGGFQPRFTCNVVINTRQDAYTVLSAVASSMRSLLYYSGGMIAVAQDRPGTPARLFNTGNVVSGIFDYASTDVRSRFNAAAITWNNPDEMYQPNVDLAVDPQLLAQQDYRETQQTAFACTNRGQALRLGRWLIYTGQYETELVSFKTTIENADVRPGDIIWINDPSRAGVRLGGRTLADPGGMVVQLDANDKNAIVAGWKLYITPWGADDVIDPTNRTIPLIEANVTDWGPTYGSPTNFLVVDNKPYAYPAGSVWVASDPSVVEPSAWRVLTVSEQGSEAFQILASEYNPEKYAYVDYGVLLPPRPTSAIPKGPLWPPTNVSAAEFIYLDNAGTVQFGILVSWTASVDPRIGSYVLQAWGPAGEYDRRDNLGVTSFRMAPASYGVWNFAVTGVDNLGRYSPAATLSYLTIGLTRPPAAPAALFILPQGNMLHLNWPPTGELNLLCWWVKWSPLTDGSATWESATTISARIDRNTVTLDTPLRAGTYLIKAVNALGIESVDAVDAICLIQQRFDNLVISFSEQPAWAGDLHSIWHVSAGDLFLPPPGVVETIPIDVYPGQRVPTPGSLNNGWPVRVGEYDFAYGVLDLGIPVAVTVLASFLADGNIDGTMMVGWVPLAWADPLAKGVSAGMAAWVPLAWASPLAINSSSQWDAHIEVAVSQDGSTWAPWFPVKQTTITGRSFKWRIIGSIYDFATTITVQKADITISIPNRTQIGDNVALNATTGALTVNFVPPFYVVPNVQLTARQGLSPGGNIVVTGVTRDYFTAQHLNSSGAATGGGYIDYVVTGYGSHA